MLTKFLRAKSSVPITLFASATSITSTLTAPANILAGDLLVFTQYVPNQSSGTVPSGFTQLVLTESSAVDHRTSYKRAAGTEGGTSISAMSGSDYATVLLVFRGGSWSSVLTGTWNSEGTDTNPASQTVTSQTGQVIVLGCAGARATAANISFSTASPAFDGTVSARDASGDAVTIGYKIYNNGSSSHTIDVGDNGDRNTFHSGYLKLS